MNASITSAEKSSNESTGEQLSGFMPTEDELYQLVKHWAKNAVEGEFCSFCAQCIGTGDPYSIRHSWGRVNEIGSVLGAPRTKAAIDEAYQEVAQESERNSWIIFHYGTRAEGERYLEQGGQFLEFKEGVAGDLARRVAKRVFNKGSQKEQERLLKEELRRYAAFLRSFKGQSNGCWHTFQIFGITFPSELAPLVLSACANNPKQLPTDTLFETSTLGQGKAFLAALDAVAKKGENALKALVTTNKQRFRRSARSSRWDSLFFDSR